MRKKVMMLIIDLNNHLSSEKRDVWTTTTVQILQQCDEFASRYEKVVWLRGMRCRRSRNDVKPNAGMSQSKYYLGCDSASLVESASMLYTPRYEVMQHLVWCA
jgi:hypothetical protein